MVGGWVVDKIDLLISMRLVLGCSMLGTLSELSLPSTSMFALP